ncbi:cation:proton antiporter [Nitratiruptor tergarcus]|uniref:Transporter, CPA2 family n=1 Tax=Nitratiruptor tergarcus DSM 16512 TaxID=1069081 RepID=A0A1W1WU93_9BACT|nr:cation:proton antiporter [Nitratiruptor tergarcus]SMC09772.1 transporter, CPA2 family [Nitratiruptor tergarcus DSM 16512]
MHPHDFFLIILIILFSARLFGEIFRKLSMPPVLGELFAGILLGPSVFGIVELNEVIKLLAEIGIILLLFEVGLETDLKRLIKTGWMSAFVAVAGFVLPFIFGTALSYYLFGFDIVVSMFIGGTITATSIGITVRVLQDLKKRDSVEGEIVVGAAVLDDLLGVILLAILYEFSSTGNVSLINVSKVFLFIVGFFIIAPIAAKIIAFLIKKYHDTNEIPGLLPTSVFMLVLFFAWFAKKIGSPEIIGGFAAGLALSRRFFLPFGVALSYDVKFSQKLEAEIMPLVYLFTPFFFVAVGLSMNLKEIAWDEPQIWYLFGTIFLIAVIGKILGALFLPLTLKKRFIVGVSMIPRGEVGLIFAEMGRVSNILDNMTYAALVLVIVVTTVIPPFIIKYLYRGEI